MAVTRMQQCPRRGGRRAKPLGGPSAGTAAASGRAAAAKIGFPSIRSTRRENLMPWPTPSTALAPIRVLDLTRVRAGPTCTRILADFGADVIKIESPPGLDPNEAMSGPRHGYDMQNLHRNKRSLTLNLKTEEGMAILRRLVPTADVVVENFRPDVKDRLGLDYDSLHALN